MANGRETEILCLQEKNEGCNVVNYMEFLKRTDRNKDYIYINDAGDLCHQIDGRIASREELDKFSGYQILVDEQVIHYGEGEETRKPYYRMRGKPVTEEQAFEIIRRTDYLTDEKGVPLTDDYMYEINFYNYLTSGGCYPEGSGWVHVDGTIGINFITGKYPDIREFAEEWLEKLRAFPWLDLVIAVTDWDEMPPEAWDRMWEQDIHFYEEEYTYDEQFYDHIQIGIWVAGKTVSFLNPEHAREKYREYERLYEDKCRERYIPNYYEKNHIIQADEAYCKRIFESYGLDGEEAWKRYGGYLLAGRGK